MLESLPNFTITYATHLIMGVLAMAAYFKIKRSYKESGTVTLDYFSKFFGSFSMFMFIQGLPALIPKSLTSTQLGSFYIFGHIFLYASFMFLVLVPLHIYRPDFKKYGFWGAALGGAIVTFVNILNWTMPEIQNNIVLFNVGVPVGPMIGILDIITMVLIGAVFFGYTAWNREGRERVKFALLSISLIVITIGGPLHDNATSLAMYAAADVITLTGLILMFMGIYIEKVYSVLGR